MRAPIEASSVFQLKEITISKRDLLPLKPFQMVSWLLQVLWLLENHGGGCPMLRAVELRIAGPQMWGAFAWGGSCPTESWL